MKIFIVTGQTATGKTSYALNLARHHNGELINADSRQIYQHLDIITGKDLTDKIFKTVHINGNFNIGHYRLSSDQINTWLYDIVDPKYYFSSFDFQQCAIEVIEDIISRGKVPIIVGGTYFYLKHLLYDIGTENIAPDWSLRKDLENKSITELQTILADKSQVLFEALNQSDRNNPQRLIRKIEIVESGKQIDTEISDYSITLGDKLKIANIEFRFIGLKHLEKEILHTKIERRVEERIETGAIQEVEQLLQKGYTKNDPGLQTIGYQQIIKYISHEYSKDKAIADWITKEKQYAKRQDTFMKKDTNIKWENI